MDDADRYERQSRKAHEYEMAEAVKRTKNWEIEEVENEKKAARQKTARSKDLQAPTNFNEKMRGKCKKQSEKQDYRQIRIFRDRKRTKAR